MKTKNANMKQTIPMQIIKFYIFACCFMCFFLHNSEAYEPKKGKVSASFGPFVHHGDFRSRPDSFYEEPRFGWALVSEAVFAKKWAVEVGLFYLKKPYLKETDSRYLVEELDRLYITTGARRWWSRHFSTGFNFFSSFSMGDPVVVDSSGLIGDEFQTLASRDSAAVYGLDLSARFEWDLSSKDALFLDLRYSFSLSALSEMGSDQANHLVLGLFYSREIRIK